MKREKNETEESPYTVEQRRSMYIKALRIMLLKVKESDIPFICDCLGVVSVQRQLTPRELFKFFPEIKECFPKNFDLQQRYSAICDRKYHSNYYDEGDYNGSGYFLNTEISNNLRIDIVGLALMLTE